MFEVFVEIRLFDIEMVIGARREWFLVAKCKIEACKVNKMNGIKHRR